MDPRCQSRKGCCHAETGSRCQKKLAGADWNMGSAPRSWRKGVVPATSHCAAISMPATAAAAVQICNADRTYRRGGAPGAPTTRKAGAVAASVRPPIFWATISPSAADTVQNRQPRIAHPVRATAAGAERRSSRRVHGVRVRRRFSGRTMLNVRATTGNAHTRSAYQRAPLAPNPSSRPRARHPAMNARNRAVPETPTVAWSSVRSLVPRSRHAAMTGEASTHVRT